MSIPCCSCCCGNVQIKVQGNMIQQSIRSKISSYEKKSPRFLYLIQGKSIEMQNIKRSKVFSHGESCECTRCMRCGTAFRFFYNNKNLYMEKIQLPNYAQNAFECNHHRLSRTNDKINSIDLNAHSDKLELFDVKSNENNVDFQLMFSNKYDPFVGSYNDNHMFFADGSLGNVSY